MPNTSQQTGWLTPTAKIAAPAEDGALDALIQSAVVGIVGLPGNMVRPRWQAVPPPEPTDPATDWCAIGVTDEEPDDNATIIHHGSGDADTSIGALPGGWDEAHRHITITVMATFYGAAACAKANVLRDGLFVAQNRDMLRAGGLALLDVGPINMAPDLINSQWRRRVDMTMRFRRQVSRAYAVRNLNQASGTVIADSVADPINAPKVTPWSAP